MSEPEKTSLTLSLPPVVHSMALAMMKARGVEDFDAFAADLIRREFDRHFAPESLREAFEPLPDPKAGSV